MCVGHAWNSCTLKVEAGGSEFNVSISQQVQKPVWDIWDPISKTHKIQSPTFLS